MIAINCFLCVGNQSGQDCPKQIACATLLQQRFVLNNFRPTVRPAILGPPCVPGHGSGPGSHRLLPGFPLRPQHHFFKTLHESLATATYSASGLSNLSRNPLDAHTQWFPRLFLACSRASTTSRAAKRYARNDFVNSMPRPIASMFAFIRLVPPVPDRPGSPNGTCVQRNRSGPL